MGNETPAERQKIYDKCIEYNTRAAEVLWEHFQGEDFAMMNSERMMLKGCAMNPYEYDLVERYYKWINGWFSHGRTSTPSILPFEKIDRFKYYAFDNNIRLIRVKKQLKREREERE